jgi:hypothetical protein
VNDEPFFVINEYIEGEQKFDPYCENCQQPYLREFKEMADGGYRLLFACDGKLCGMYDNPYIYDLNSERWVGKIPDLKVFEDEFSFEESPTEASKTKRAGALTEKSEVLEKRVKKKGVIEEASSQEDSEWSEQMDSNIEGLEMPLLTMSTDEYESFLKMHNGRVVVLIDVPNFLRTLHHYFPNRFERILKRSHILLLKFIDDYFPGQNEYIIRYFSKPDDDLRSSNMILAGCARESADEYFHMLRIHKSGSFSDIDNYLISNGVEILERCEVKGFAIVSSDKDYLPVMRIADYRGVKSCMIGVNTSEIYEQYNIGDIKFLNVLKYARIGKKH